jgi:hypothetical protein
MATDSSFSSLRHDALDAARDVLRNTFGHADFVSGRLVVQHCIQQMNLYDTDCFGRSTA